MHWSGTWIVAFHTLGISYNQNCHVGWLSHLIFLKILKQARSNVQSDFLGH